MDAITNSAPAQTQTTAPAQSESRAQDQKNQFLQLLVAQLKGQNPLNPMEGSEFVAQLAQFSSLEELTRIRGTMESVEQLLSAQNELNNQIQNALFSETKE